GMIMTDNVLTKYVNGVDGILAGVSTYDAMLPYVLNLLPKYKDDPVIVTAMKEDCHRNLYAIANSVGMNEVGPRTTIKVTEPKVIIIARTMTILFSLFFVASLVMWIKKKGKFKQSEPYTSYIAFKEEEKK